MLYLPCRKQTDSLLGGEQRLMESSNSSEAPSGSVHVRVGNLGDEQPHQSLFSLLLDIESRLRAEARRDSLLKAGLQKPGKCKKRKNLSRYIE